MNPEQVRRLESALQRQEALQGEIGVPIPVGRELARTADAAIVLLDLWVFSTAVTFRLCRLSRLGPIPAPGPLPPRPTGRRKVVRRTSRASLSRRRGPVDPFSTGGLLVAVKFSDGRSASYLGWGRVGDSQASPVAAPAPTLDCLPSPWVGPGTVHGFLLSDVPPAGPVALVVADRGVGIDPTVVTLDGDAMQDARTRVQPMPVLRTVRDDSSDGGDAAEPKGGSEDPEDEEDRWTIPKDWFGR